MSEVLSSRPKDSLDSIVGEPAGPPTVVQVTSSKADGSYTVGENILVQIEFSKTVVVTGVPRLEVSLTPANKWLNYVSGTGTKTLTFQYTVGAGDTTADLSYVNNSSLELNGGVIKDSSDQNAILSLPVPSATGSLDQLKNLVIDTTPPLAFSIAGVTGSSDVAQDAVLTSGLLATINWASSAGASNYDVTIRNAANTSDVCALESATILNRAFSSCNLSDGISYKVLVVAKDLAGNSVTASNSPFDFTVTNALGTVTFDSGVPTTFSPLTALNIDVGGANVVSYRWKWGAAASVDCTDSAGYSAETLISVNISQSLASLGEGVLGEVCAVGKNPVGTWQSFASASSFTWTKDTVAPNAATALSWSSTPRSSNPATAEWTKSNSGDLFNQHIQFYSDATCTAVSGASIDLTSAVDESRSFTGTAGSTYSFRVTSYDQAGNSTNSACSASTLIDVTAPTATIAKQVGQPTNDFALDIYFTITFSEAVTGFTIADLSNTGTAGGLTWSLSTSDNIVWTLTTTASGYGTLIPELAATSITDLAGNSNALASTSSDTVTYYQQITVTGVSSTASNGSYKIGDLVPIEVTFSGLVTVTGTPRILLETGTTDRHVNYLSGTTTSTLVFNYTVQSGDISGDLEYESTAALTLNGGTILDPYSNAVNLALPTLGAVGSLANNKNIVIDGVVPDAFTITGATGGSDSTANNELTSGLYVTANWNTATGASTYDVRIRNAANTSDVCALQNTAGTSYSFPTCSLVNGTSYLISVIAKDAAGNATTATNNLYSFTVNVAGTFSITGITGGSDALADATLAEGAYATVAWSASATAVNYKVKLFADDGVTTACAEATTAGTSYAFSSCSLSYSTYYKAQVIAVDAGSGEQTASNSLFRFFVSAAPVNVLGNAVPPTPSVVDGGSVELGVKFQSTCDGKIMGVRFYRGTANGGGFQVNLWTNAGGNLATKSTVDGATLGWREVLFDTPVTLTKNTTYVVSYFTSGGYYAAGASEFVSSVTAGCLTLMSSGGSGGNGVFVYSGASAFPTDTFNSTNYYVDPIFKQDPLPNVLGVTGGADTLQDNVLAVGVNPTVNWETVPTAGSYDVVVYQDDGVTVACALVNVIVPTTNHAFSGCTLSSNTYYKAKVFTRDGGGVLTGADSSMYRFHVGNAQVFPVYVENGASWNDFIRKTTNSPFNQADASCSAGTSVSSCAHGGELRKVVTTRSTCTGITAADSLSAFDWICQMESGNAVLYSKGLKTNKALGDLVTEAGWIANSVVVSDLGTPFLTTSSASWWTNTVTPLPDNSAGAVSSLASAGTIYVLNSSRATTGYNINADKVALVVRPGATLRFTGAVNNCNALTAETAGSDRRCLVAAGAQKHIWIEGAFEGQTVAIDHGIVLEGVTSSTIRNFSLDKSNRDGVVLNSLSSGNNLKNLTIINVNTGYTTFYTDGTRNTITQLKSSGGDGVGLGGSYNRLLESRIANSSYFSLNLGNSYFSQVHQLNISNAYNGGIQCYTCWDATISMVTTSWTSSEGGNQGGEPLNAVSGDRLTVLGFTGLTNLGSANLRLSFDAHNNTVVNVVGASGWGAAKGLDLGPDSNSNLLKNLGVFNFFEKGLGISGSSTDNIFSGHLLMGENNFTCDVATTGLNPGLVMTTCANQGLSSATFTNGFSVDSSYVGRITSDDTVNASDTSGAATFSAANDWLNFENFFRSWGRDSADWTTSGGSYCSSGTCRIWDWRLVSTDTVLKNRNGGVFAAGTTCPAAAHGNQVMTDQKASPHTFLINAYEIVDNWQLNPTGNNNGLCESNEGCIYAPNMGSYQGHGDYEAAGTCTFQDGTVTGVKLYGFPINGVVTSI